MSTINVKAHELREGDYLTGSRRTVTHNAVKNQFNGSQVFVGIDMAWVQWGRNTTFQIEREDIK